MGSLRILEWLAEWTTGRYFGIEKTDMGAWFDCCGCLEGMEVRTSSSDTGFSRGLQQTAGCDEWKAYIIRLPLPRCVFICGRGEFCSYCVTVSLKFPDIEPPFSRLLDKAKAKEVSLKSLIHPIPALGMSNPPPKRPSNAIAKKSRMQTYAGWPPLARYPRTTHMRRSMKMLI